jgi:hypothetical protein
MSLKWMTTLVVAMAVISSCAPDEKLPEARSSAGLSMDGTHWTAIEGAPDLIDSTKPIDAKDFGGWSTAPVPLPTPYVFAVGTRNGRVYIFSGKDELKATIDMPEHEFVDQLLSANGTLIAITATGSIRAYSFEGKQLWNAMAGGSLTGNAVIVGGLLVTPTGTSITALGLRDGKPRWTQQISIPCISLAVSRDQEHIAAAISFNESGRADSILAMKALNGARESGFVVPGGRITSNVTVADKDGDKLLFGVLGEGNESGRAASAVEVKDWLTKPTVAWSHPLPYIVLAMSANSDKAFASGFRNNGGDLVSGIDAFKLRDTTFEWKRRFTEPVSAPPAVGEANIYLALSFETEAIVGSRALFYNLKSGTGETVSERSLKASTGVLPVMPMPDEQGRFLLPDRERPVVFTLDRSTLKRVF